MSFLRVLCVAASALALVGCEEWGMNFGDSQRYREDFHFSYDLKPGGRVSLENMNGSVEIFSWEKNTVDIVGTKYGAEESAMKAIKIDVSNSPDLIAIRTIPPSGHLRGGLGAKYVLRVPKSVELDRIVSSNGSVRIENTEGNARIRTSNGAVRITQLKGRLEIETSNGGIELNNQSGGATLRTSNGSIKAENVRGNFEANTSNAKITARIMDPEPNRLVKLESSNGAVDLTMDNLKNNDIRCRTSNASINLHLPSNLSAQMRASTSNSHIESDFDLTLKGGRISKTNLDGTIGSGGPLVDLSTSNGSIRIQKL